MLAFPSDIKGRKPHATLLKKLTKVDVFDSRQFTRIRPDLSPAFRVKAYPMNSSFPQ